MTSMFRYAGCARHSPGSRSSTVFALATLAALGAWLLLGAEAALADAPTVWQPPAGHTQVPIWPGKPPGRHGGGLAETVTSEDAYPVAGRPWLYIGHVSEPTITVYHPGSPNVGAAVLVFPGGGYQGLAIDLEGTEVCDWLITRGVTCAVLKYRVPAPVGVTPYWRAYPASSMALQDAQRALRLMRHQAKDWGVDPHKIGVLGFSAGGHLVTLTSVHFNEHIYPRQDAADDESARPDFAVALYPGHLALWPPTLRLNPDIATHISAGMPPTFLVMNEDDNVDNVDDALSYYIGLRRAGASVEMHLYAQGKHGFGLRPTELAVTGWPALAETWLRGLGVLPK